MPAVIARPTPASPRISSSACSPEAKPRAFAHRVADVAEHEQVAERGAGQPDEIVRLAGDEALGEVAGCARGWRPARIGLLDLGDQRRIDRHLLVARKIEEAVGEIDVVGRERGLDFARGDIGIRTSGERVIGERAPDRPARRSAYRASKPRGTTASAAIAQATATPSGKAIRAPVIDQLVSCTRPDINW